MTTQKTPAGWDAIEADDESGSDDVPNLDGMWPDDLRKFAMDIVGNLKIPTGPRVNLMNYGFRKADAMEHREAGRITQALQIEAECDRLYRALPESYRW